LQVHPRGQVACLRRCVVCVYVQKMVRLRDSVRLCARKMVHLRFKHLGAL
jgi:hypothetical protein